MSKWATYPDLPGTFPVQALKSPPFWEPPSVLDTLGWRVTPAFRGHTHAFLCALFLHQLREGEKKSKIILFFNFPIFGKTRDITLGMYTQFEPLMSRFYVNISYCRIIFGFIERKKIQFNLMMKEAGRFYGSSFISSCTTTLLCSQGPCNYCSSTSARGQKFYRHLNR